MMSMSVVKSPQIELSTVMWPIIGKYSKTAKSGGYKF